MVTFVTSRSGQIDKLYARGAKNIFPFGLRRWSREYEDELKVLWLAPSRCGWIPSGFRRTSTSEINTELGVEYLMALRKDLSNIFGFD